MIIPLMRWSDSSWQTILTINQGDGSKPEKKCLLWTVSRYFYQCGV